MCMCNIHMKSDVHVTVSQPLSLEEPNNSDQEAVPVISLNSKIHKETHMRKFPYTSLLIKETKQHAFKLSHIY